MRAVVGLIMLLYYCVLLMAGEGRHPRLLPPRLANLLCLFLPLLRLLLTLPPLSLIAPPLLQSLLLPPLQATSDPPTLPRTSIHATRLRLDAVWQPHCFTRNTHGSGRRLVTDLASMQTWLCFCSCFDSIAWNEYAR